MTLPTTLVNQRIDLELVSCLSEYPGNETCAALSPETVKGFLRFEMCTY